MIKKFIRKVLGLKAEGPLRVPHAKHAIDRSRISPAALKVCGALQEAGFSAYVVGGAVRDLLLGATPKDYDVATNARPEQVKPLFRRALLIGRRFRIVHVIIGQETIEVSTFRAAESADAQKDEHGRVLRDNVFGTQEEDALRRDFSVNALYYDPATEEIIDFHEGLSDLKKRTMRVIGDPAVRYREDPVRMLRAVRLAAKLGLSIEASARAPIKKMAPLIGNVPPARLFDEMLKLLMSGHASACVRRLRDEGLSQGLLPLLDVILDQPLGERFVMLALENTDKRINEGKPVSPGFLFASLLWHEVLAAWKAAEKGGMHTMPALFHAMDQVLQVQAENLAIPRRYGADMKDIWALQARLLNRSGRRPYLLLEHPRFRAGFDFLLLRCACSEIDAEIGTWWEKFQQADEETRAGMLMKDGPGAAKKRRRPRRKKKPAAAAGGADAA